MRSGALRVASLLTACAVAAAGCAGRAPARPAPAAVPIGLQVALLSAAGRAAAGEGELVSALNRVTQDCMLARGQRWRPPASSGATSTDEVWRPDLATRRTDGYGGPAAGLPAGVDRDDPAVLAALIGTGPPEGTLQLAGARIAYPTHGCAADGLRAVYGDVETGQLVTMLPQLLGFRLAHQTESDARLGPVRRYWEACMHRRGFPDSDPAQARVRTGAGVRGPGTEARAVALADGRCALEGGAPQVLDAILATEIARLPQADRTALQRVAQAWPAALANAGAILTHPNQADPNQADPNQADPNQAGVN